jgi:hypothetical protein
MEYNFWTNIDVSLKKVYFLVVHCLRSRLSRTGAYITTVFSEVLLAKLPDQFSVHFRREGVLHQVCILIFRFK